jgi:hypothetical protein
MTLSIVRSVLETNARDSLVAAGVPEERIVYDNTGESPPLAPYAVVTVTFGQLMVDHINGCLSELLIGSTQVNVYGVKQAGPDLIEDSLLAVLRGWCALNALRWDGQGVKVTIRSPEGPRLLAADVRPLPVGVVVAAFTAQVA